MKEECNDLLFKFTELESQNKTLLLWLNEQRKSCIIGIQLVMEDPHTTFRDAMIEQEKLQLIDVVIKGLNGQLPLVFERRSNHG